MGILRLVLALSVVVGHSGAPILGFSGTDAFSAVQAFFMISGFYITLVLDSKYISFSQNITFWANRFLRLYPAYLIGLALSIIAILLRNEMHDYVQTFDTTSWMAKLFMVSSNLTMLGQDIPYWACVHNAYGGCLNDWNLILDPPTWSLSVELMFYAVAPFIVRQPRRIAVFLLAGLLYHSLASWLHWEALRVPGFVHFDTQKVFYFMFPSSVLFFALGALSYHVVYKRTAEKRKLGVGSYVFLVAVIIWLAEMNSGTFFLGWKEAILLFFAIPVLFNLTTHNRFDRFVGDLSYPIYVVHFPLILVLRKIGFSGASLADAAAAAAIVLAVVIAVFVESPVDKFRQRFARRRIAHAGQVGQMQPCR